ncbi:MAG: hypothetical protein MUD08_12280 [Cytophagales bacterium]|nr:hypothetical protein [Cytophagales bacterium]
MNLLADIRKGFAWAVLTAFVLSWGYRVTNYHLHRLSNGEIVVHAHPYKKDNASPFQRHKHSPFEMFWLGHLAKADTTLAVAFALATVVFLLRDFLFLPHHRQAAPFAPQAVVFLRGPPSLPQPPPKEGAFELYAKA